MSAHIITGNEIGIFYGSSTCYTEIVAEKIRAQLGEKYTDIHNIADASLQLTENYQYLLIGIPTWDYGELQEDWEDIWPDIQTLDLKDKKIALFGLGDQVGYPDWFLDAMGYLHEALAAQGANLCGYSSVKEFEFNASKALDETGELFVGLALDEENDFEKTDSRIERWCQQILEEFSVELG